MLGSTDVQAAMVKLDLMPFEAADFACSHSMAIGDQDHRRIPVTMPIALGGFDQALDLALGKIAAGNCEVYSVWCADIGSLFCHEKSPSVQCNS
jgi:hypothetical protein